MKNIQNEPFHKEIQQIGQQKMQCDCKNGNSEISFFSSYGQFFLLSVFSRGLQQYNRFNLKSSLRGEAVIFRKRHRKRTPFIFPAESIVRADAVLPISTDRSCFFRLQKPNAPWRPGVSALADTPEGGPLTRRRRKAVRLWRLEKKVAFMKVKQALIPHFPKLQRQSTALHAEIIRKLLAGERNVEFIAAPALRLGGKIGHELCPRCALAHMGELFIEPQVLLRQFAQQVADDPAMVGAGGGAHAQNAPYV